MKKQCFNLSKVEGIPSPRGRDRVGVEQKVAFTLAEVLITLGVIGVVAAMTLPTLIQHNQKQQTVSQLKKVYTNLNQALKLSQIDNDEFQYWDTSSLNAKDYFEKYWKPYLKTLKYCDTYKSCGYSAEQPWIQPNGKLVGHGVTNSDKTAFILSDGTYIGIYRSDGLVLIDLNGAKSPNRFGKDLFSFNISKKGILKPHGEGSGSGIINEYCTGTRGETCSYRIIYNGWEIDKNYPW